MPPATVAGGAADVRCPPLTGAGRLRASAGSPLTGYGKAADTFRKPTCCAGIALTGVGGLIAQVGRQREGHFRLRSGWLPLLEMLGGRFLLFHKLNIHPNMKLTHILITSSLLASTLLLASCETASGVLDDKRKSAAVGATAGAFGSYFLPRQPIVPGMSNRVLAPLAGGSIGWGTSAAYQHGRDKQRAGNAARQQGNTTGIMQTP